ncbi:UvrD-helicase domain-containing protein [Cetobacterium sp.]|uniref:nuclease-related domain-containing protein n=1 Tax=Cetobacterium sp. TaxID=2071632 RepID=UPI003EE4F956
MENRKGEVYEELVYEYIKDYFIEKDVICLKSYDIFNANFSGKREIDILLLHREYGIVIIEVKGLHINNISSVSGDSWSYKDFYTAKGNPYKQAESQLRLLMNHLKKIDLNLANKLGQKIIIALPLINSYEWEKKGFNNKPNCPPIIFKDDLLFYTAKKKIKETKIVVQKSILSDNEWKKIQDIFGVITPIEPDILFDVKELLEDFVQNKRDCDYSALYCFSNKKHFKKYIPEIRDFLREGKKVFLFTNFEISSYSFFEDDYNTINEKDLKDLYQLQIFINSDLENLEEFIIYDGKLKENKTDFFNNNFPSFNWEQFQIVHAQTDKNLIVKAGAGTGKTHVMIDRIIFLLLKNKTSLNDIIMITFTNESTQEMKERLKNKFLDLFRVTKLIKFLEYAEETNKMQISTIHSFFKNIITSLSHHLGYGNNINLKNFKYEKNKILDNFLDLYFKKIVRI